MEITLGQMKSLLESLPQGLLLDYSFKDEHSYRGMYDCASVEPAEGFTVVEMLSNIENLLEFSYSGWKGGEFCYDENTPLFFAYEGRCEDGVGYHEYDEGVTPIRQYFYKLINKGEKQ